MQPTTTFNFQDRALYNPAYLETFDRREPVLHYYGSAGSGKSYFVAQKEIVYSFYSWRKNRKTLVARRTYNSLAGSCFDLLVSVINDWGLSHLFKINKSPYSIQNLVTGVRFIFSGLDDIEKLKSIQGIDRGWLEEATEVRLSKDFDQLRTRLRGFQFLQWTLSYNPTDAQHWLNTNYHVQRQPGHFIFKTTYKDNVKMLEIDKDYERREVLPYKESNPNHYRVYALGEWGKKLEGLVFPNYSEIGEMPVVPQAYGLDLGWNDPIALCKVALVDEFKKDRKQLFVEESLYARRMDIPEFISALKQKMISKKIPIIYDPAQPGPLFAEAMTAEGYYCIPADKSAGTVKGGIAELLKHDLRPVIGGKNLFAEFNGYSFKDLGGSNGYSDEPQKGLDHLMDAMRYATSYITNPHGSGMEERSDWY